MSRATKKPYHDQPYLPFSAPWFGAEEKGELLAALESDWITTGPRTKQFEKAFAAYIGTSEAVAVNSCTVAAPGTRHARCWPSRCRNYDTVHVRRDGQRHCSRGSVPSLRRYRSAYL